jgi:hypothetical protein
MVHAQLILDPSPPNIFKSLRNIFRSTHVMEISTMIKFDSISLIDNDFYLMKVLKYH